MEGTAGRHNSWAGFNFSEATIWRTLQRAGLITPEPKKKPKTAYRSFAAELQNQMWQTDFPRC